MLQREFAGSGLSGVYVRYMVTRMKLTIISGRLSTGRPLFQTGA